MQRLVIVGGGFAGVWAALGAAGALRRAAASARQAGVTLVSRDAWLTIRPRLYESSLEDVRVPLDAVLPRAVVERVEGNVVRIDPSARTVAVERRDGPLVLAYDRLILAAGSGIERAGVAGAPGAFAVDTYADAVALHEHLVALPSTRGDDRFTAVVIGAGLTGIEVATELVARLRVLAASDPIRVVLVGGAPTVAPDVGADARRRVEQALGALGIEVLVGRRVKGVDPEGVTLEGGARIRASTTVWTAGMRASTLGAQLPGPLDALGRVSVDGYLRVRGADGIYAAGDVAHAMADASHVAPMSCQHAIPMGERAGTNAMSELLGRPVVPYEQSAHVTCLDLGSEGALFMEGWQHDVRLSGFWAKLVKESINTRLIYPPREPSSPAREPWNDTLPAA